MGFIYAAEIVEPSQGGKWDRVETEIEKDGREREELERVRKGAYEIRHWSVANV